MVNDKLWNKASLIAKSSHRPIIDVYMELINTTNQQLHQLMDELEMDRESVAEALSVSVWAVDAWLKPPTSKSHRKVPTMALQLLRALQ